MYVIILTWELVIFLTHHPWPIFHFMHKRAHKCAFESSGESRVCRRRGVVSSTQILSGEFLEHWRIAEKEGGGVATKKHHIEPRLSDTPPPCPCLFTAGHVTLSPGMEGAVVPGYFICLGMCYRSVNPGLWGYFCSWTICYSGYPTVLPLDCFSPHYTYGASYLLDFQGFSHVLHIVQPACQEWLLCVVTSS